MGPKCHRRYPLKREAEFRDRQVKRGDVMTEPREMQPGVEEGQWPPEAEDQGSQLELSEGVWSSLHRFQTFSLRTVREYISLC